MTLFIIYNMKSKLFRFEEVQKKKKIWENSTTFISNNVVHLWTTTSLTKTGKVN